MKKMFFYNILRPLLARIGTALAALLVAQGVDASLAEQAANGLAAIALISVDLAVSYYQRSQEAR